MQQYRDIKARCPGAILFFRMGDFYEMFEDDARVAARDLGLTLTSRNNGGAAAVPLAGVPVKAAAEYLRRRASVALPVSPKPRKVRCPHTGAMIFAADENRPPLTTESVREILSDFP